MTGGRCPAWMATTPWTFPYTPPSQATDTGNGTAYDNADFDEALVLGHGNSTHLPNSDNPVLRPRHVLEHAPGRSEFPVRRRLGAFPHPAASTPAPINGSAPSPATKCCQPAVGEAQLSDASWEQGRAASKWHLRPFHSPLWEVQPCAGGHALVLLLGLLACGCGSKKSTDELIEDLKAPEERERIIAVRLLPQRKEQAAQVVPALIEALKDKDGDVRRSAALGLGSFGEQAKDAIPALEAAKSDRDARVREAAGIALSRIDPARFPGSK